MIKPTVGRVLWFIPSVNEGYRPGGFAYYTYTFKQPCAAHVTYVWNDHLVNLLVLDHDGKTHPTTQVPLLQDDEPKPEGGFFACWMPFQKGQVAKSDAFEEKMIAAERAAQKEAAETAKG